MKISLLHLSDIHIHSNEDPILARAHQIASTCYEACRNSDALFIVITGDIAFSGSTDEYNAIIPFLKTLKDDIQKEGSTPVEIILVPGNHDCTLLPEKKARTLLIDTIIENPDHAEDESVIDTCVSAQVNYFDFRKKISTAVPKLDHKLLTEYEFLVANHVIRFSAINASWMSRIPENPGQLIFPTNKFRDVFSEPAELRFVLLHHPLNWYCQSTYHDLRTLIRTHATAILSGHEHINSSGEIIENNKGSNLYFEAAALQPHERNSPSGYSLLQFFVEDIDKKYVTHKTFNITVNNIDLLDENTLSLLNANASLSSKSLLTREFKKQICDPGGGFIHPDKEHLEIDDIFVYPELKRKKVSDDQDEKRIGHYSISAEEVLFSEPGSLKLILIGEDKAGKTTTLYQAYKELHNQDCIPIFLKAPELGILNESDFSKMLEKQAKLQYADPNQFIRAEKKKRVALVDDIDRLRGGLKNILRFVKLLEKNFSSIILTAASGFEISELVNKEAAHVLHEFQTYEITRFGHAMRHKLIRKWCLCGQALTLSELDKQVYDTENIVNIVVGKNLVPSQPFYLLILLQSSSINQQAELKNSSFAHYYEYLMTGNLAKSGVKRDQYDELFNYLSHLAWFFRSTDISEASISELANFNIQYSKLIYKVDLQSTLDLLTSAKLLSKRGEFYSFSYPYVFFFFLGRYLAKNLHKQEVKDIVGKWCTKLANRNNGHAILFLTYHVNDPWVIEQVASSLSNCFKNFDPIQLNGDINFINELVDNSTEQLLRFKELDVDENQIEVRRLRDESESIDDDIYDSDDEDKLLDVSILREFQLLIKTGEILGQIVKNYYGSLERLQKQHLIKEVFDAPLRFLRFTFELINNDPEAFVLEIQKAFVKKNPELVVLNKKVIARNIAFTFLGQICTAILVRTSGNVSSDKLDDDINHVIDENCHTSYKLLKVGTKFISPKNLPFDEIRRLAKEFKNNPFAFGILQSLGALHLHHFHLGVEDRQKLCDLLGINVESSQVIDYKTKDTKILK